jgi:hypothetical protein
MLGTASYTYVWAALGKVRPVFSDISWDRLPDGTGCRRRIEVMITMQTGGLRHNIHAVIAAF